MGYPLVKNISKQLAIKEKIYHYHSTKVSFAYI